MFPDRISAGRLLAPLLEHLRDRDPVILALPRGGVPVGVAIAEALGAPLDLILVRKIGAPYQPELAIGAIAEGRTPLMELDADAIATLGILLLMSRPRRRGNGASSSAEGKPIAVPDRFWTWRGEPRSSSMTGSLPEPPCASRS